MFITIAWLGLEKKTLTNSDFFIPKLCYGGEIEFIFYFNINLSFYNTLADDFIYMWATKVCGLRA